MKLCRQCGTSLLPFLMVFLVAGVSSFLTWLTLTYAQFEPIEVIAGSGAVFLAVAGTLLHYVHSCMKRHCRHGTHGEQQGATG
jgi:hypothetical protein